MNITNFLPAISKEALVEISREVRRRRLHRQIELSGQKWPVRGWMQYYGAFYRSEPHPLL
ncbi:hypothetical protein [Streptosporangium sandarakinum]|uniref:hypothetical protein n=1 Tax=Streptosporangium sandarakinum TaxID=1260955 RepID=UPI0033A40C3C